MSHSRLKQTFNEPRGHSSAVASVLFTRGNDAHVQITKSGSYIYDGKASDYHEWEFRTRLRMKAAGNDERFYAEAMSKVVGGLRGEAFIIAKETGLENLWETGEGSRVLLRRRIQGTWKRLRRKREAQRLPQVASKPIRLCRNSSRRL